MKMQVNLLRAGIGDCILVRCGSGEKKINILIDSGQSRNVFKEALIRISEQQEKIDVLILTHDDNDHVKGACSLLEKLFETNIEEQKKKEYVHKSWTYGICSENERIKTVIETLTPDRILFNFGGNGTDVLLAAKDIQKLSKVLENRIDFHQLDFILADEEIQKDIPYPNMIQLRWDNDKNTVKSEIIKKPTEKQLNIQKTEHIEFVILSPKKQKLINYINEAWERLNDRDRCLAAEGKRNKEKDEWSESIQYWLNNPKQWKIDEKKANGSSIAFLLIYGERCALFAGDANPDDMLEAGKEYLKRTGKKREYLSVDFIKLPHHGSSHNVSQEFLRFFRTKNYLISTSGHEKYKHPGKGTLAKIAAVLEDGETANIYSNYAWWKEKKRFEYAEKSEGNWDKEGHRCILTDKNNNKKYLRFYNLGNKTENIGQDIQLSD